MIAQFAKQYDKRSWLEGRIRNGWRRIGTPGAADPDDRERLRRIEGMESEMESLTDAELQERSAEWKSAMARGTLDWEDIVEPAFTLAREASRRVLGLFPYPVQVLGGLSLVRGCVAEQATGEGKTLTTTLPAYCFGLTGKGVHVSTVNSYLAERDFEFARPLFEFLGLSIGFLRDQGDPAEKREIYRSDVVYGTGYEYGFDYLRDQLQLLQNPGPNPVERLCAVLQKRPVAEPELMHRRLGFAIVDEVDSVLIDEASSPLLISGPGGNGHDPRPYQRAAELASALEEGEDYRIDRGRSVILFRQGNEAVHRAENIPWESLLRPWKSYIVNALVAGQLLQRDADYLVDDDAVVIVDGNTGRAHAERSWRDGLHQAVETKEGVTVKPENQSVASITRQRFFARYERIGGLTGTAAESEGEFWNFFRMPVAPIPPRKPCPREVLPERIFVSREHLFAAVAGSILEMRAAGRPVLVGTRTIRVSEALSERLSRSGVPHEILTAKHDEEESRIISEAGRSGSVVIATNMAGRGTHISLDGKSLEAGGLHVIAIERNESRRIDRQLIGRCSRQGEPGSCQSFVSAEDDLVTEFGEPLARALRAAEADGNGEVSPRFTKAFDRLQQRVEKLKYAMRLQMWERDKWNEQTRNSLS